MLIRFRGAGSADGVNARPTGARSAVAAGLLAAGPSTAGPRIIQVGSERTLHNQGCTIDSRDRERRDAGGKGDEGRGWAERARSPITARRSSTLEKSNSQNPNKHHCTYYDE